MTDEAGTVSPDLRIRQLEEDLLKEKDRLDKLYTGYMELQKEVEEKAAVIDVLEKEAIDKEIEIEGIDSLLSEGFSHSRPRTRWCQVRQARRAPRAGTREDGRDVHS